MKSTKCDIGTSYRYRYAHANVYQSSTQCKEGHFIKNPPIELQSFSYECRHHVFNDLLNEPDGDEFEQLQHATIACQ